MRIAIIDCGTNTFHLLIADTENGSFRFVLRRKMVVKLASNRNRRDLITDKAFERAVGVMLHYRHLIGKYKPDVLLTAGTAALRDAKNGRKLVQEIEKTSGIRIKVITGIQEANLICEGVLAAVGPAEGIRLIMDIGGGSTEFILCRKRKILWKQSFKLGAAELIREIAPSDPMRKSEILKFNRLLEKKLQALIRATRKFPPEILTGASGSFDTFASMILHRKGKPGYMQGKTQYNFKLKDYEALHHKLLQSTYAQRLKMPGMLKMRADMIVTASLLLTFVLRSCNINQLELSTYALKEGLLVRQIRKNHLWPKS